MKKGLILHLCGLSIGIFPWFLRRGHSHWWRTKQVDVVQKFYQKLNRADTARLIFRCSFNFPHSLSIVKLYFDVCHRSLFICFLLIQMFLNISHFTTGCHCLRDFVFKRQCWGQKEERKLTSFVVWIAAVHWSVFRLTGAHNISSSISLGLCAAVTGHT